MFSCCNLMTIRVFSTLSAVTFFRTSWTKVGSKEKRMNRIESNRRHSLLFFGRCFSLFLLMGEMIDVALSLPNLVFKRGRGMPASASAIAGSDVLNHQFDDYRSLHRPGTILLILFRCHPSIRFWHHTRSGTRGVHSILFLPPHFVLSQHDMVWGECSKSIWKLRRNPSSWNWWWWLLMRWCTSIQSTSNSINNYQATCPIESVIIHWAER